MREHAHAVPAVIETTDVSMVKETMWNPVEAGKHETKEERKEEMNQIIKRMYSMQQLPVEHPKQSVSLST